MPTALGGLLNPSMVRILSSRPNISCCTNSLVSRSCASRRSSVEVASPASATASFAFGRWSLFCDGPAGATPFVLFLLRLRFM